MGFSLNEKSLRRAGMDYIKNVKISVHENIFDFLNKGLFSRYFIVTKYGKKFTQKKNTSKMIVSFLVQNQRVSQKIF